MRLFFLPIFIIISLTAAAARADLVDIGTAGSIILGSPQGPTEPPGAKGAPSSVSSARSNLLDKLINKSGFPCELPGGINVCGNRAGNSNPNPDVIVNDDEETAVNCPVKSDISGTFGPVYSATPTKPTTMPCGGVVTLDSVETSFVPTSELLAIVDGDSLSFNIYQFVRDPAGPSNFKFKQTVTLPQQLCRDAEIGGNITGNSGSTPPETTPMPQPTRQWVFIDKNATQLVLRSQQPALPEVKVDPANPNAEPKLPTIYDERFLTLPVQNGEVKFDANACPTESSWFRYRPQNMGDVWMQPTTGGEQCQDTNVTINSGVCAGNALYMNLDNPALVHQPGREAIFYGIEGRSELVTVTTDTSYVMLQPGSALRLGSALGDYILAEGGYMKLKSGNVLRMNAPATVDPGSGNVTLTGGGYIETPAGVQTTVIAAGAAIKPQAEKPYDIYPNRKIMLPYGLLLPVKVDATLRLPIKVPD